MMQKAIRREIHKMHAFVRFRRVEDEDGERYVAWFEPEHDILERIAPFFAGRFPSMRWSILTPLGSLHWDGERAELAARRCRRARRRRATISRTGGAPTIAPPSIRRAPTRA